MELVELERILNRLKQLEAGPVELRHVRADGAYETIPVYIDPSSCLRKEPIPEEYKDLYPIEPPFIEAHTRLDRNYVPKGPEQRDSSISPPLLIRVEDITEIELLIREHLIKTFIDKRKKIE